MATSLVALPRLRRSRPQDFTERYGGFLVSLALWSVVLAWALMTEFSLSEVREIPPAPLKIILQPAPAEDLPAFEEAASTSANTAEIDTIADAALAKALELLENPPQPASLETWTPRDPNEQARLQELEEVVRDNRERLDAQRTDLAGQIDRLTVESAGREFLLNSDGGRAGIVRTIDLGDFSEAVVRPVLARYGITIEYRYVSPDEKARTFLNAAVTSEGTFTSVRREGYAEVFVLSPKAVSMMASMETAALMDEGYDIGKARIRKVVFGIVMNSEGNYALGVTDLEVERVR